MNTDVLITFSVNRQGSSRFIELNPVILPDFNQTAASQINLGRPFVADEHVGFNV